MERDRLSHTLPRLASRAFVALETGRGVILFTWVCEFVRREAGQRHIHPTASIRVARPREDAAAVAERGATVVTCGAWKGSWSAHACTSSAGTRVRDIETLAAAGVVRTATIVKVTFPLVVRLANFGYCATTLLGGSRDTEPREQGVEQQQPVRHPSSIGLFLGP